MNAPHAANALKAVTALLPMNFSSAPRGGLFSCIMRNSWALMLPRAATRAAEPGSYFIRSTNTTGKTITTTVRLKLMTDSDEIQSIPTHTMAVGRGTAHVDVCAIRGCGCCYEECYV